MKRRSNFFNLRWEYQLGAVAASLLLAVSGFLFMRQKSGRNLGPSWDVARLEGAPRVGWHSLGEKSGPGKLAIGQTLVTDGSSRASITLDETGRVEVDPGSRLRLVRNGPGRKRLSLERGTIHAVIWAPPGEFVVDTPSAVAVDLGCVYTLHVDDSGSGLLHTTMGWVGFKLNGRESFIPAGAICQTRPKVGPGTPYFEDASASFRDALSKFDFTATRDPPCGFTQGGRSYPLASALTCRRCGSPACLRPPCIARSASCRRNPRRYPAPRSPYARRLVELLGLRRHLSVAYLRARLGTASTRRQMIADKPRAAYVLNQRGELQCGFRKSGPFDF